MFEYQRMNLFTATIAQGLEEEGAKELIELGAGKVIPQYRAISFEADIPTLMKITVMNRLCSRILAPLAKFPCNSDDELYQYAFSRVDWDILMCATDTFCIFANVGNSNITNSHFSSLNLKDAIADYFRELYGARPSVNRDNPDVNFAVGVFRNEATLSLDIGHGALHKRGYRLKTVEAPLQETLAAALIRISGWDGSVPLYDPFCGSGTILSEAAMFYCNQPPSPLDRTWGFERLPEFEPGAWGQLKREIQENTQPLPPNVIFGSDVDFRAVDAAKTNLSSLPVANNVTVSRHDFAAKPIENAMIICNPPYGIRLDETENVKLMLKQMGDFLKHQCQGSTAWILVGDKDMVTSIGLKPSKRLVIKNGDIECRFVEIKIREFLTPR